MQLTAKGMSRKYTGRHHQILLAMKLTVFLLIALLVQVSARTYSQSVTLNLKSVSLEKAIKEIASQSHYQYFFQKDQMKNAKKVTIDIKETDIVKALDQIFDGQPFKYAIQNKTIVVFPKAEKKQSALLDFTEFEQELTAPEPPAGIDVSITVMNADGQPLDGASIVIKGAKKGITTSINGRAILKGIDQDGTILVSFTGFESQEIKVNNRTNIFVRLIASTNELDQIQIIAYGQTSKRLQTGNVATIKGDVIEKQPVSNPLLALSGRVPGLLITQANGYAGSNVSVEVQGQNSMRGGSRPFYVIDGVPFDAAVTNTSATPGILLQGVGNVGTSGGSPFNFINPSDIESVEVLKDADATSIYGSRAASGAILITTKKGKAGQTNVNVNLQSGWGKVQRRMDLMNTEQYLSVRKQALQNDNLTPGLTDYDLNGAWDQNRYTDWQKELIGKTAHFTNMQASVSGGTANTQFLIGTGYIRETTVIPGDYSDSKASVHFNINHKSNNQKFLINLSASYLKDQNTLPLVDLTTYALTLAPNAPALYDANGNLNWAPLASNPASITFSNPLVYRPRMYTATNNNLVANSQISYELIRGLQIKSSFGYTKMQGDENTITPQAGFRPDVTSNVRSHVTANRSSESYIIEPQISYKRSYQFGTVEALVGTTYQQSDQQAMSVTGSGYGSDAQIADIRAASTIQLSGNTTATYRYSALFSRINYQYKDRYIVNFSARRDGSSRFGSENQFNNFYSIAGAWILSEENWTKKVAPFVSFAKIKASYGSTGNDQIGDYKFLNLYTNLTANVGNPYQQTTGILPSGLSNPYLEWESTRKLGVGLDLGFFKNRILFNTYFYSNRSSNQLLTYPLPLTTGFGNVQKNLAAVLENKGWEFLLDVAIVKKANFSYNTSFNLSINRNKLIDFPGLAQSTLASSYVIGRPVNLVRTYHYTGVDPQTGLYTFLDANGQITSSPNAGTDQNTLVDVTPQYYGGWTHTITYKGLSLDVLFQFVNRTGLIYAEAPLGRFTSSSSTGNFETGQLDYWKNPGDIVVYAKPSTTTAAVLNRNDKVISSDARFGDASFVKLKNVSLSYLIPQRLIKKMGMKSIRVYAQGQNLLTITKYKGLDPEMATSSAVLPPLTVYTLGIQLNL